MVNFHSIDALIKLLGQPINSAFFQRCSTSSSYFAILLITLDLEWPRYIHSVFSSCVAWFSIALSHNLCFSAMLRVQKQKIDFRHIMLFYLKKQAKILSPTARKIYIVYRQSVVSDNTVRKWFEKFKSAKLIFEDDRYPLRWIIILKEVFLK